MSLVATVTNTTQNIARATTFTLLTLTELLMLGPSSKQNEHNWGEPERAPHKRYFNARSVYIIIMVRPSPARRFIYSVLGPHAMFSAVKSAWSKQLRHSTLI